jgi:hypothetical protein
VRHRIGLDVLRARSARAGRARRSRAVG